MMEERLNDLVPTETIIKYLIIENKKSLQQIKNLNFQLGQEKAYIEELEESVKQLKVQINNLKLNNKTWSKEIKKEETYVNLKHQLNLSEERVHKLKETRDMLINEANHYKLLLQQNNLL